MAIFAPPILSGGRTIPGDELSAVTFSAKLLTGDGEGGSMGPGIRMDE
jgi:hypothetical protein